MIDPRLRTLRVLSEVGTVTAAAKYLHLAPSSVSQQLRQLQNDLGVSLVEPAGRKVRLTDAAHTLVAHSGLLFTQWEKAEAALQAHRDGVAGKLAFSAVASALATLVAPAACTVSRNHPHLEVSVGEDPDEDRFRLLANGRIDICVTIMTPDSPTQDDSRFEMHPLLEEHQDALLPRDHRFAHRRSVRLAELAEERWLRAGDPRDQHQLLLNECSSAGFRPRVHHNAVDWFAVASLVGHGLGICLIPRLVSVPDSQNVVRVPLAAPRRPVRQIVAYVRFGSVQQRAVDEGLKALRSAASAWTAERS